MDEDKFKYKDYNTKATKTLCIGSVNMANSIDWALQQFEEQKSLGEVNREFKRELDRRFSKKHKENLGWYEQTKNRSRRIAGLIEKFNLGVFINENGLSRIHFSFLPQVAQAIHNYYDATKGMSGKEREELESKLAERVITDNGRGIQEADNLRVVLLSAVRNSIIYEWAWATLTLWYVMDKSYLNIERFWEWLKPELEKGGYRDPSGIKVYDLFLFRDEFVLYLILRDAPSMVEMFTKSASDYNKDKMNRTPEKYQVFSKIVEAFDGEISELYRDPLQPQKISDERNIMKKHKLKEPPILKMMTQNMLKDINYEWTKPEKLDSVIKQAIEEFVSNIDSVE